MSIYPHTVTVWHRTNPDERDGVWEVVVYTKARLDEKGASRASTGTPRRSALLIVDGRDSVLSCGDFVAMGQHDDERPPSDAWRIAEVRPIDIDTYRVHWEADLT